MPSAAAVASYRLEQRSASGAGGASRATGRRGPYVTVVATANQTLIYDGAVSTCTTHGLDCSAPPRALADASVSPSPSLNERAAVEDSSLVSRRRCADRVSPVRYAIEPSLAAALIYHLEASPAFAARWLSCALRGRPRVEPAVILLRLKRPPVVHLNRAWNRRVLTIQLQTVQLHETMAWLSTLGGGYSALGDSFGHHARTAGKIAVRQYRIAVELGHVGMELRCFLYLALSMMQQGVLKTATSIIRYVRWRLVNEALHDSKLAVMLEGVDCKLNYCRQLRRKVREAGPLVLHLLSLSNHHSQELSLLVGYDRPSLAAMHA